MVVGYKAYADNSVTEKEAEKMLDEASEKLVKKMPKWNKMTRKALVNIPFTYIVQ